MCIKQLTCEIKSGKLIPNQKKPPMLGSFLRSVETVLKGQGYRYEELSFLIAPKSTITDYLSTAARYAVSFRSICACLSKKQLRKQKHFKSMVFLILRGRQGERKQVDTRDILMAGYPTSNQ